MNNVKGSPITTIAGIIGGVLIVLGLVWPDKLDPDTQAVINTAVNEILIGVGGLIEVITAMFSKDPKK
ncbi:MAG: hypothetical protein KAJ19_13360 [Gammaproteobacteria bacterium]|nr:hypothetical protein [Gammaproteobacteria bacterium]